MLVTTIASMPHNVATIWARGGAHACLRWSRFIQKLQGLRLPWRHGRLA